VLAHYFFEFGMAAALGGRDSHIAQGARLLHGEQQRQMHLPSHQIVHLEQVEAVDAPEGLGFRNLLGARLARGGPHLVGGEERLRPTELSQPVADDLLGGTVHWGGIDQPAACREERTHHRGAFGAQFGIMPDVESYPAAQAEDRQFFAGRRYRFDMNRAMLSRARASSQDQAARRHGHQERPAGEAFSRLEQS
jgi:hypothetical protein